MDKTDLQIGQQIKSNAATDQNGLTTWRILEITVGEITGKVRLFCEACHDTKHKYGVDSIKREFTLDQIELD